MGKGAHGQDVGKHHEDGSDIDGCSNEDDDSQEERGYGKE